MNGDEPSFSYTAVIRTLGTAGQMYQTLLNSLCAQTIQPERILVYIAEGYPLPKETCGREEYIYCKKGMVAQRSLAFDEVATEWILFCDDDIQLESDTVARLYEGLMQYPGSLCIAPNTFPNHLASPKQKLASAILSCTLPHYKKNWAFIIRKSTNFSYNNRPQEVLPTQSAAGPCCLVQKQAYLRLNFANEAYLDGLKYALGEDVFFF